MNMKGGSKGTDWSDGGSKPAEGVVIMEVNPLTYVSKGYALNKAVGLFTWAEAMRQFGFNVPDSDNENKTYSQQEIFNFRQGGVKEINNVRYHLPNRAEWQSIVPYWISPQVAAQNNPSVLDGVHYWTGKVLDEVRTNTASPLSYRTVQIGNVRMTGDQYTSKFITKKEGDVLVTYAKRFIGTPFESAWRYSYDDVAGNKMLHIQCLSLRKNSNVALTTIIARKAFFDNSTDVVKRYFPTYGYRNLGSPSVDYSALSGDYWSSVPGSSGNAFKLGFYGDPANSSGSHRRHGFALRPFVRN